ncbi:hypothetical protein FRC08_004696 [Ceratobasidium sp. 394]|nr:hypothetical protein FRC08_004696 [Ceratobasidium sp. 394]
MNSYLSSSCNHKLVRSKGSAQALSPPTMHPRPATEQCVRRRAAHMRTAEKYIEPSTMAGDMWVPCLNEKLPEKSEFDVLKWFNNPEAASLSGQECFCAGDSVLNESRLYAYHPRKSLVRDDDASTIGLLDDDTFSLFPKPSVNHPTPLDPGESKSAIEDILETFDLISATFAWPDHLDFLPAQVGRTPELANTHHNAPWIEQQGRLLALAVELECIPTYGSASIRNARAEAADLVRNELCKLDAFKTKLWEQHNREPVARRRQAFWKWLTTVEWD